MASREELLQSIHPDMKLNKPFFLKIYGYEISEPGFKDKAIKALQDAGCSRAEEYYRQIVGEYQAAREKALKAVSAEYVAELNKRQDSRKKEGEQPRKQKKIELLTRKKQLLNLLKSTGS